MNSTSIIDTTVVILSAGHGTRMLSLTENTPKPLLKVGNLSLIEHHLIRLKTIGFQHIIINIAYLGDKIRNTLGNGSKYGLNITYSDEADTGALETAGGIKAALPLIKSDPFIVINADIWTDYNFSSLLDYPLDGDACLVMVKNPEHNSNGDFGLSTDQGKQLGLLNASENNRHTYSGIGLYSKPMFQKINSGKHALGPLLRALCKKNKISGTVHQGVWKDIGTPERLEEIKQNYQLSIKS